MLVADANDFVVVVDDFVWFVVAWKSSPNRRIENCLVQLIWLKTPKTKKKIHFFLYFLRNSHLNQCCGDNIWINCCHNTSCICWYLHRIIVLEYTMWLPATIWFIFPIALYLISCFFDYHMTFGAILLKALTFRPFWTNTFVSQCRWLMPIWTASPLRNFIF